ncbi:corrinoid ABC transporter substrate-binding protein [Fusobacterium polymorphum]|uniref:Heme ABC superfamily ATP binding cassette transporter binding protein HmuT n=1 Tax=Fusobacterium polymorphum ATCC 10953 TaxID=393480 RepID=A5TRY4_FUSNP|nr:ABC transporter substrate-binding protein [Fusobacterium polymorphum]EDK87659.1 heme ABC superfamily ATP binding cassette transporter binding protein HmuT [Fusobacterium polymorphum ATCC 10953]UTI53218.1 ABC transporter substrate-binding protein [Fusobacterium polymorphum]WRL67738.1 ABC transporter substrate-binding protein [Fusobacterium polymorphum]CKG63743.1 corrinoid ABC transporter substrate-binding protein [Fusobacterium polymorphum]
MKKLFLFLILLFSFTAIVNAKEVQAKKYNHIVSLTLSGDEMLLGLVPENRIAGLSGKINEDKEISNIVDKAKKFPKVEGNEEVLMSLEPDLIIVADWLSKRITDIGAITGAKVYFYKTPNSYEEQKKLIRDLANLVEEKENGEKLIKNMDDRLKALQDKIAKNYKGAKPRILMYTSFGTTSGKNTTFNDMVKLINGVNVVAEAGIDGFKDISKEKVIELNPDIIIVPIAKKYDNVNKISKLFFEDPSFKNVKAIKNKKVYFIQYKDITPTSQYMINSIEELAKVVYQFKE